MKGKTAEKGMEFPIVTENICRFYMKTHGSSSKFSKKMLKMHLIESKIPYKCS